MKKTLFLCIISVFVIVAGTGTDCTGQDDRGDFSIEILGDTVKTISDAGGSGEFDFNLRNHTSGEICVTINVPPSLNNLPEGWDWMLCVGGTCKPPGEAADICFSAGSILENSHLSIITSTESTASEGHVTMHVTHGDETDHQTFLLKLAQ